jgi:hypothetical protein
MMDKSRLTRKRMEFEDQGLVKKLVVCISEINRRFLIRDNKYYTTKIVSCLDVR